MPFEIVRNDIVNMQVDAVVNTASHLPRIGYGVDFAVHKKAGPQLLMDRLKIGEIQVGHAAITPGYNLDADYVIHVVSPAWRDGGENDRQLLRQSYESALRLALENHCESIAFPLLSAGNHGFPNHVAMQIAVGVFSEFLMEHDLQIYLVVFGEDVVGLSGKLFHSVASYIDEKYVFEQTLDEYGLAGMGGIREGDLGRILRENRRHRYQRSIPAIEDVAICSETTPKKKDIYPQAMPIWKESCAPEDDLGALLKNTDAGFSETLLKLIDRSGKKDPEIYKKANVDKKLFSKIKNNPAYKPSKPTAIAFAIALELNLEETKDLIGRAGFALSHSSQFDIIIEYFITRKNYDMFEINETLFDFDQSLLGV